MDCSPRKAPKKAPFGYNRGAVVNWKPRQRWHWLHNWNSFQLQRTPKTLRPLTGLLQIFWALSKIIDGHFLFFWLSRFSTVVIRRNFPVGGPTMTAPTHVISEILAVWFWTVTSIACQVIYPNELGTKPIVYENKKKQLPKKTFLIGFAHLMEHHLAPLIG